MKSHRMALLALIALLLFAGLPASPALAGGTLEYYCNRDGGSWSGPGVNEGTCTYPPGSVGHDEYGYCSDSQNLLLTYEHIEDEPDVECADLTSTSQRSRLYCSPVFLARTITSSPATPISFKGSHLIKSASLSIPGFPALPISGLTFDPDTNTWSGFVNTLYIPAGYYSPVRVIADADDLGFKACHFGGLVVE